MPLPRPNTTIATMNTGSEPGRISTAHPAALPRHPTIRTGRATAPVGETAGDHSATPLATVNTVKPMPVTSGLRCSDSTTNSGTIAARTPSEAQLSARLVSAAARNAGSRIAWAIVRVASAPSDGPDARMWRGSSSRPVPPAAARVPA